MVVIGPQRLPEYSATLGRWVRQARSFLMNAQSQVRSEMGPEFDDVDWTKFDPRQYDPRRIVREALQEDLDDFRSSVDDLHASVTGKPRSVVEPEPLIDDDAAAAATPEPVEPRFGAVTVLDDGEVPPFDAEST